MNSGSGGLPLSSDTVKSAVLTSVLGVNKQVFAPNGGNWYCCGCYTYKTGSGELERDVSVNFSNYFSGGGLIGPSTTKQELSINFSICVRIS